MQIFWANKFSSLILIRHYINSFVSPNHTFKNPHSNTPFVTHLNHFGTSTFKGKNELKFPRINRKRWQMFLFLNETFLFFILDKVKWRIYVWIHYCNNSVYQRCNAWTLVLLIVCGWKVFQGIEGNAYSILRVIKNIFIGIISHLKYFLSFEYFLKILIDGWNYRKSRGKHNLKKLSWNL